MFYQSILTISHRFDCGTGIGVVTTENKAPLGKWSSVTLHRKDWDATLQLNEGPEASGRSEVSVKVKQQGQGRNKVAVEFECMYT